MAATSAATRLITAAARQTLAPPGIRQKRRSRSWFTITGWWLVLIEFQRSSSRVGTYLNVGAMWLWSETDHWTFDEGHRSHWRRDGTFFHSPPLGITGTTQCLDFTGEEQFARDVDLVVDVAARRTVQLRQHFTDPPAVARHLTTTTNPQINTPWRTYSLGVAAGLSGDTALARQAFAQTTAFTDDGGWTGELAQRAGKLADPPRRRPRVPKHHRRHHPSHPPAAQPPPCRTHAPGPAR
jgi:hypothetical protein